MEFSLIMSPILIIPRLIANAALFLIFLSQFSVVCWEMDTKAIQSTAYEDFKPGQMLRAQIIEPLKFSSLTGCAMACNRNQQCLSFNFCGRFHCELIAQDAYSTPESETNFATSTSCSYWGISKLEMPVCKEKRRKVDIQNDLELSVCKINQKRIDAQWGDWGEKAGLEISGNKQTDEKLNMILLFLNYFLLFQLKFGPVMRRPFHDEKATKVRKIEATNIPSYQSILP